MASEEKFPLQGFVTLMDAELLNQLYGRLLLDFSSQSFMNEQLSTARRWVASFRNMALKLEGLSNIKGNDEFLRKRIGSMPEILVGKKFPQQIERIIEKVRRAKPPSAAFRNPA